VSFLQKIQTWCHYDACIISATRYLVNTKWGGAWREAGDGAAGARGRRGAGAVIVVCVRVRTSPAVSRLLRCGMRERRSRQERSTQEVGVQQIVFVDDFVPVDDLDALVVHLQVLVHVQTRLVVEEELGASDFTHGGSFAGIFDFGEEEWGGRAVLVSDQVASVFAAQTEVPPSPERRDNTDVFVFVASQPSCVFLAFHCTVISNWCWS